jgi:hypothetical protein
MLLKIMKFFFIILLCFSYSIAQYNITGSVIGNGAGNISGDSQNMRGTVGQSIIGKTENTTYQSRIGFWYTVDWIISDINTPEELIPLKFKLFQNHPNPFNPVTTIRYALPKQSHVLLEVYNLLGQRITTLVNKQMPAGYHDVTFGVNNLTTGFYIYRIQTDGFYYVRKMLLIK